MTIRKDKNTDIYYTYHNIPCGGKNHRKGHIISIQNHNGFFKIFESNHDRPDYSWYDNIKVCSKYAVFKWVNTSIDNGFYQQVSPWYVRYGNALRKMIKLSN